MSVLGYRIPSDYKNQVSKYTHSWKHPAFFTMHPGLAYVTHHRHLMTGDRVRGSISQLVQSQPMLGPLMNGFRMITIATFTPDSIFYGWMRNGIRYSPDEWKNFDKWIFNPVILPPSANAQDIPNTYAGVAVQNSLLDGSTFDVISFYLTPTVRASNVHRATELAGSELNVSYYNMWNTPYYVPSLPSDGTEDTTYGFYDNLHSTVGRGGLFDCMGIPPGSVPPLMTDSSGSVSTSSVWSFDVAPWLSYFLSHYYYLANMQEDFVYYSNGAYSLTFDTRIPDSKITSALSNVGFSRAMSVLKPNDVLQFISSLSLATNYGNASSMEVTSMLADTETGVFTLGWLLMGSQAHGGLLSVPYRPDFFNNIIKAGESPTVTVDVTPVDGENGQYQLAIPDLRAANKWQNIMDRLFVGQGRFGDQLRALFGTNSSPYTNKPDFLGIWQASINPTNVVAQAAGTADGESSVPGQMTARLDSYSDYGGKSVDYYVKEPGTLMFISFLVPMPAYSQGLHPDLAVTTFADEWNPELAGSGFTSVPRWRYSMLPQEFSLPSSTDSDAVAGNRWLNSGYSTSNSASSIDPLTEVVGDSVAFDWLKTDYPRLHGEFAFGGYFEYWTLNRRFVEYFDVPNVNDGNRNVETSEYYGTYINPYVWQYIFTTQSVLDPNFFVGFNFDLKVTSSVPAGYMPYLGR